MACRVVAALSAALVALPLSAAFAPPAFAQAEHAQRIALEVAIRRAQVRAALCEQHKLDPAALQAQRPVLALPTSPPTGTGGPVALPAQCPQPADSQRR